MNLRTYEIHLPPLLETVPPSKWLKLKVTTLCCVHLSLKKFRLDLIKGDSINAGHKGLHKSQLQLNLPKAWHNNINVAPMNLNFRYFLQILEKVPINPQITISNAGINPHKMAGELGTNNQVQHLWSRHNSTNRLKATRTISLTYLHQTE